MPPQITHQTKECPRRARLARCVNRSGAVPRLLVLGMVGAVILTGCRNGGEDVDPGDDPAIKATPEDLDSPSSPPGEVTSLAGFTSDVLIGSPPSRAIPPDQNSPRAAAQAVALMANAPPPPASDELAAHQALLAAAMDLSRRSGFDARRFALRPPLLVSGGVSPREYYLRVLASLVGEPGELAWVDRDASDPASLPGTREPATTIRVDILSYRRLDARWTEVAAELVVTSPDGRVVGQRAFVERRNPDQPWSLRLDPLRWTR